MLLIFFDKFYCHTWLVNQDHSLQLMSDALEDWQELMPNLMTADECGILIGMTVYRHAEQRVLTNFCTLDLSHQHDLKPFFQDEAKYWWDQATLMVAYILKFIKDIKKNIKSTIPIVMFSNHELDINLQQTVKQQLLGLGHSYPIHFIKQYHQLLYKFTNCAQQEYAVLNDDHTQIISTAYDQVSIQTYPFGIKNIIESFLEYVAPKSLQQDIKVHLSREKLHLTLERLQQGLFSILYQREIEVDVIHFDHTFHLIKINQNLIHTWVEYFKQTSLFKSFLDHLQQKDIRSVCSVYPISYLIQPEFSCLIPFEKPFMSVVLETIKGSKNDSFHLPYRLVARTNQQQSSEKGKNIILANINDILPLSLYYQQFFQLEYLQIIVIEPIYIQLSQKDEGFYYTYLIEMDLSHQLAISPDQLGWQIDLFIDISTEGKISIVAQDSIHKLPILIRKIEKKYREHFMIPDIYLHYINQ